MAIHLPLTKQVRDLLTDLLGREVTLAPTTPYAPGPDTPASVAVYVDDSLHIRALIVGDLAFSAHAGAALGLVPVGGAHAAIDDGKLTDTLAENLYEVLNIAASTFNVAGAEHLRLHALHPAGPPLDPQLRISTLTLGRREDLKVSIAGYGDGLLSVVLV
ncbi:hypothetical protein GUY44_21295 [Pimelobacter simplex]|uniref:Response regulator receiver n=1 Tax=Nocardioides simplex TaxID=2045 RepID=A0A0A1DI58_NOCSI|nr:hypothetical protein [Pimelobacter simplex]AIY16327.1 Response regulator receiver [Pimelobacter simplex]MCG8153033.1 hypothetical protein [Pimelobacter simplex]GEB11998.1 hypothetical protein NSI01_03130 [Pimelobacter simplex]SFN04271.1 hypothetical protein SAMN05421671_4858 [Pimelobacter simplex]